jgi:hypothetical protein
VSAALRALEELAGAPDFAVCVMVWPWPDGGWNAGLALCDRAWAEEQGMSAAVLALTEESSPTWDVFNGFANGINVHGHAPEEAIAALVAKVQPPVRP